MDIKTRKTRVEYLSFSTNQTLVLEEPAQVIFMNTGAASDRVVINNNLILSSIAATNGGTAQFPSTFTIKNNANEVDTTNYTIRFVGTADPRLYVMIKYYVK
jgi:hypothetical protein